MAMDVGKRGGAIASINVTPMADVMIVLLIIFMVMTPVIAKDPVHLPNAANAQVSKEKALDLMLDERGQLTIGERAVGPFEPALPQLQALTESDPERPVRLKADRSVPYTWVSRVLGACRGAQAQGVSLAAERPEVK